MKLEYLQDPKVYKINRIDAHSDHHFFIGGKELKQSLNGEWDFAYAHNSLDLDIDFKDKIKVPGHMELQGYGQIQYVNRQFPWDGREFLRPPFIPKNNKISVYKKDFVLDKDFNDKEILISFQGVERVFYLYLNDKFVGYSEDSFTPSEFKLNDYLISGLNTLKVFVSQYASTSYLEDQDMFRFTGIFRDVYLYANDEFHIKDLFIHADLIEDYKKGLLTIDFDKSDDTNVEIFLNDKLIELPYIVEDIKPWSAESPNLYDLKIILYHKTKLIEIVKQRIGFRNFKLINDVMCINGKRIIFNGINRHEFSCDLGRAITEEEMLFDIKFMKKNNINAVRTSHYPNNSYWYDLCDEYGIYLIDETNLESHGTWQKLYAVDATWNVPKDNMDWLGCCIDRANSMLQRDKNHPSILIWSLGNESYAGKVLEKMSEYFHENDLSRLVHYEGCFYTNEYLHISDMTSRMYAKPAEIEEYLNSDPHKPYISCEYMHAMGNSLGGMKLYTDLKKYPLYQGGFIWDYIDQALVSENRFGKYLAYGGDHQERPSDYDFSGDGIIFADRKDSPKVIEVKKLYENVKIDVDNDMVIIENNNLFIDTKDYYFEIELMHDGNLIESKKFELIVKPFETNRIKYDFNFKDTGKYLINVSMKLKYDTIYAKAGFTISTGQKVFEVLEEQKAIKSILPVYGDNNVSLSGDNFFVNFSLAEGGMTSLVFDGVEYIETVPTVNYFRALTNNDKGVARLGYPENMWLGLSLYKNFYDIKFNQTDEYFEIKYLYNLLPGVTQDIIYRVNGNQEIIIKMDYHGIDGLPEMPEYSMNFRLPSEYNHVTYYGRGPVENYIDRNNGTLVGKFTYNVEENLTKYLCPQDCGNRTETYYFEIDNQKNGLRFEMIDFPFEFSVLPVTTLDLIKARHLFDLPSYKYTDIRIKFKEMGVGGDDSWGARVHKRFTIPSNSDLSFSYKISKIK